MDVPDSDQRWVEGYITLVIPEEQRQYSTGRPLVVVADTWQVAPISADGTSESHTINPADFGRTTEVNFDGQGTARIRVLGEDGSNGSLAVIGPSTPADKVVFEPQDGTATLVSPESGNTTIIFLVVGALAALGILAGIVFFVYRRRSANPKPSKDISPPRGSCAKQEPTLSDNCRQSAPWHYITADNIALLPAETHACAG